MLLNCSGKVHLGHDELEVVYNFKYLGLHLSTAPYASRTLAEERLRLSQLGFASI